MTQREAEIDIDVEGEDREREEEIESEGRRRCRCRCRRRRLGLEPRLMSRVGARARAKAKVEVGETRARNITPEFHAVYFSFITLLHCHIQLLYQHGDDSPIQTHPISMGISVVAICIYGLATLFAQFCSNYSQIFKYVTMVSGVLYPVYLISVFIPNGLSCLLYIIWLIFSVMVVPRDFLPVCNSQWILQMSGIALINMTTCTSEFKLLAYKGWEWALGMGPEMGPAMDPAMGPAMGPVTGRLAMRLIIGFMTFSIEM